MANTIKVDVVDDAWTEVVAGAANGYMTGEGIVKLKYRESNALPAPGDVVGHTLEAHVGAFIAFALVGGQNLYVRSTKGNASVSITLE